MTSRPEILQINPVFTHHLLRYQDLKYNPRTFLFKTGDDVLLRNSEESVVLTKTHAAQLNQENIDYFNQYKDSNPFKFDLTNSFCGEIGLKSNQPNGTDYLTDLADTLEGLRIYLQQEKLIVLGEWPVPWLSQKNEYLPVKNALSYLSSIIDKSFVGGFELSGKTLKDFIPHLFWLTRCNAGLPEFRFSYTNSKTVFSICKYGILHLDFYDALEKQSILEFFENRNFSAVEHCSSPVEF